MKNTGDRLATLLYLVKGLFYRWFTGENVRCKYYVESLCLDFFVNRSWISKKNEVFKVDER